MSAYPITIQPLTPEGSFNVPQGSIVSSKFEMGPSEQLLVTMIKPAPTQDFSLRCWFSRYPGGPSIELIRPIVSFWHPNRAVTYAICLHTDPLGMTEHDIAVHNLFTQPGTYYLNVLNLVNSPNSYTGTFQKTAV